MPEEEGKRCLKRNRGYDIGVSTSQLEPPGYVKDFDHTSIAVRE